MYEVHTDSQPTQTTPVLDISFKIQIENSQVALTNRARLDAAHLFCLNIISALGVGATSLIECTVEALEHEFRIAVIEGDTIMELDAKRLQEHGAPVVDLTAERAFHMNANLMADGLDHLEQGDALDNFDLLFVEHVGDLICPAVYALGEHERVVVVDVTEDEDKPLKNPLLFHCAHCIVVNKLDLAPDGIHDHHQLIANIRTVNPQVPIITLSVQTGEGIAGWLDWLRGRMHRFAS